MLSPGHRAGSHAQDSTVPSKRYQSGNLPGQCGLRYTHAETVTSLFVALYLDFCHLICNSFVSIRRQGPASVTLLSSECRGGRVCTGDRGQTHDHNTHQDKISDANINLHEREHFVKVKKFFFTFLKQFLKQENLP